VNCGCGVGYEAEGYHEFFEARIVTARKQHVCCECRKAIRIRDKYEYTAMKYDGDFSSSKTCLPCADVREAYTCDGSGVQYGEFWQEMREHVFPDFRMAGECWDKCSADGKQHLVAMWKRWKGLAA
jgi:hypothetical protein